MQPIPANVEAFRIDYRRTAYGPFYRGWAHFAFTSLGCLSVIAVAISRVRQPTAVELLTVPTAFLVANAAEYFGHRGPMHRRKPLLGLLYQRHTQQHHHFFTHEAMAFESPRDFKMVLFPPVMLFFFLGGLAAPMAALAFLVFGANVGFLFLAVAMSYFLTYEWLHFCYHLPPSSWVSRLPGLQALRRHHTAHHDLSLMARWNFNITFPVCDAVFGTRAR